jgi:murein DD-endopeptidase MepM/ murein hydrolase activator NlpD
VFDLNDSLQIYEDSKPVEVSTNSFSASINHSLFTSLSENGASIELAVKLSQIFAWQVDFYAIQKGDRFKVIYEEKSVGDKIIGIGDIVGAYFQHRGTDYYAIPFEQDSVLQFFDQNGNSLRKAFLKAPLEFSRISSRFSKNRFHPILKRNKPHLGTDYAAPHGTPIRTIGDGIVLEAGYSGGNGNYVKIKHNSTYITQYLHMSRFAQGIRKGVSVKQGQVIGYVGSTGLATGPHLCFRFWKNGVQVDPYKEVNPPSYPVKPNLMAQFDSVKTRIMTELDMIGFQQEMAASL